MAEPFQVEVVAADRRVWQGRAVNVIVRTTEGDIGILPGHEPLLAQYATLASEVTPENAQRDLDALQVLMDSGDATDEEQHRYHLALAQLAVLRRGSTSAH